MKNKHTKHTKRMKQKNTNLLAEASRKSPQTTVLEEQLPMLDLILEAKHDIEAVSTDIGLKIMHRYMEQEIERRCGPWGEQSHYRHGREPGYVVFHGRKVAIQRPRLRRKAAGETALASYRLFQQNGRMQRAVARKLIRQVSTRNYAGAIDDCLEGYGIGKSSVSRHWKIATAAELEKLCQRPVPPKLVALVLDGQSFRGEHLIVGLGIDEEGQKHVLGLWHGATENSTVVRALLADLRERGLDTESAILVVIDGAKALHKAVKEVFGERALIQRCRIHKLRNVIEHLPKEKQQQAAWRLRGAWAKPSAEAALQELRATVKWLDTISPSAARSLEDGLVETLTLHRLGINELLRKSLSSTNLIESCFSRTEAWTRRVKRWRNGKMVLRWGAAALLVAEAGFQRVRGYAHLPQLKAALVAHQNSELETMEKAA
jgi:transposase-like protein